MNDTPKPAHQRPELPEFWDHRFREGVTPWDAGRAPAALQDFARRHEQAFGQAPGSSKGSALPRVLIPGCGSAWDAAYLDRRGWRVTALDFSPDAVTTARSTLGDAWHGELRCADFFDFETEAPFDVIYERAFLCALPRSLWPSYAPRMARLLPAGGLLAGFFFIADQLKGPPFGILDNQLEELLAPFFVRREDQPVDDSLPVFAGRERWQVWERH